MSDLRAKAAKLESLLPKLMRAMHRISEEDPLNELPMTQIRVLRVLFCGPRTPSDLGDELSMSPSAVAQMVHRMEDAGLVERTNDQSDRRVRHVKLTEHAHKLWEARRENRIQRVAAVLETMPPSEVDKTLQAVENLVQAARLKASETDSPLLEVEADIERPLSV